MSDCLQSGCSPPKAPRFFRSLAGEFVVMRNKDLQRFATMPEIGAVPPAVLFGPAFSPDSDAPGVPGSGIAGVISNQVEFSSSLRSARLLHKAGRERQALAAQ